MVGWQDKGSVSRALQAHQTGPVGHWILLGYAGDSICLQGTGTGGVAQLVSNLKDDSMQYMLVRITAKKDGHDTHRDVFIHWTGPGVKGMEKAKKRVNLGEIESFMVPNHGQLEALSKNNFTEAVVYERSHPGSGSHVID